METLHTNMIWPVQAPCQIAYRDLLAGYFWLRPYVDLSLKNKIWGIAICGQVFCLHHEQDGNWFYAQKLEDKKSKAKIPSTTVIDIASRYRREFDATVELLQSLRIKAEAWRNGWYWTNEEAGDNATILDMANGRINLVSKKMHNGYVRLVSNYIVHKPITLGYSLAYLNHGHLELSCDLKLQLKDTLWGLHVGKSFLCMHLTFEPQKIPIRTGLELCASLSNDNLLITLPSQTQLEDVAEAQCSINDTLVKLHAYGVKVNLIYEKELYWLTNSIYSNSAGFVTYGNRFISADKPCLCRLFGKNKDAPVVI